METKASQTDQVDTYMQGLKHNHADVIEALRKIIMSIDDEIGEEIKWNAPTFFYSGPMTPSDPKAYKRYITVSNLHRQDSVMLVFPSGAQIDDGSGFLHGQYADGRRLLEFFSMDDVKNKKARLQALVKQWLETLDKR